MIEWTRVSRMELQIEEVLPLGRITENWNKAAGIEWNFCFGAFDGLNLVSMSSLFEH